MISDEQRGASSHAAEPGPAADGHLRATLVAKGSAVAGEYSYQRTGEATRAVYERALAAK